ncbi:hypothetical protein [Agrobacterium rosae]|uniref:Uncharacterized protein n=1 Tax=Agrobacterium rosae TaxID=1972867 RepID=A0A1R3TJR5_9HYPH|nr:hypothetical protein [Agrobacterium rosae]SCX04007.1 hypothetical protein DSM25559_0381 [Agrobacterium rosae]
MFLNELGCDQSPDQMARILRQLADDLERVPDKSYLLALEPEAALASWSYCARQMVCLTGTTVNHPEFDKTRIQTSEVFYLNRQVGLVRTFSRWYRLLDQSEAVQGQRVAGSPLF